MGQVQRVRTPIPFADACRAIDAALLSQMGRSSARAVGKILAVLREENGVSSAGGVPCLWNVWNNNPGNLKPGSGSADFVELPGATEFDSTGKQIANPSVRFAAFATFAQGAARWVWQVQRRWPAALVAALDDSQPAEAVAEGILSKGVADNGALTWPPYASAAYSPKNRAAYKAAVAQMGPPSIAFAQGIIPPKAGAGAP